MKSTRKESYERNAFELNPDELDRRAGATYADFYLMLLGLTQGIATTILVANGAAAIAPIIETQQIKFDVLNLGNLPLFLRYVISFTVIVIVTYEYTYAIAMFRRYPRYRDVIATLFLGISEVLSIYFIANTAMWWLMNGVFALSGFLAYVTTISVQHLNFSSGSKAAARSSRQLIGNMIFTTTAACICVHAFWQSQIHALNGQSELTHIAFYFFVGAIMILRSRSFLPSLRKDLLRDAQIEQS